MSFISTFLKETEEIARTINTESIEFLVSQLVKIRNSGGRLFILGCGGSAGHASHAVNDFRKICGIESYAPTDNVSELTARTNDEGWNTVFAEYLKTSKLNKNDGIFIFSVGGGSKEKNVSANLVEAIDVATECGAAVMGIVGRDGGYTGKSSKDVVIIPTVNSERITPHTEGFAAVVWHLLVSHPDLQIAKTKWESTK